MKRRLGNLKGAPIVEGDENLMTSNEVNYDTIRTDRHWMVKTNDTTGLKGNPDLSKGYKYIGTACFPVNVLVPKENVNVYSAEPSPEVNTGGSTTMRLIPIKEIIPANTGVLITSKIKSPVFYQTTKTVPFTYYAVSICVYKKMYAESLEDLYPEYNVLVLGVDNTGTVGIRRPAIGSWLDANKVAWLFPKQKQE